MPSNGEDFNQGTWLSLMGLLHPSEFLVPVDQTTLWRRHIAWAKPNGKDIRDYTTQRFSSNMVFLSLLLGSQMSTLFNSAKFSTDIRYALRDEQYGDLKFLIGCVMVLGACVTAIGLIATFTAWSMISAISDSNAHSVLRSSMGQYVTNLPSRFVVAALYLFLTMLVLLIIEIASGPVCYCIVALVVYLFFQTVVSLSSFGRLIIHTGAMGQKKILDPEFERHLLPSGLHASLLILATNGSRRRTSVTSQYRHKAEHHSSSIRSAPPESSAMSSLHSSVPRPRPSPVSVDSDYDDEEDDLLSPSEMNSITVSARAFRLPTELVHSNSGRSMDSNPTASPPSSKPSSLRNMQTLDPTIPEEIPFPRPSVLNRVESGSELRQLTKSTLSKDSRLQQMVRRSSAIALHRHGIRSIASEWQAEHEVRGMYDIEPPDFVAAATDEDPAMTRAQKLNESRGFRSLKRLLDGLSHKDGEEPSNSEPFGLGSFSNDLESVREEPAAVHERFPLLWSSRK